MATSISANIGLSNSLLSNVSYNLNQRWHIAELEP